MTLKYSEIPSFDLFVKLIEIHFNNQTISPFLAAKFSTLEYIDI